MLRQRKDIKELNNKNCSKDIARKTLSKNLNYLLRDKWGNQKGNPP